MRQVLIDHARIKKAQKRIAPGDIPAIFAQIGKPGHDPETHLAVKLALDRLRDVDPAAATVVWLRCVEGLTLDELSHSLGREVWRIRADCDFGLNWMASRLRLHKRSNEPATSSAQARASAGRRLGSGS